MTAYGGSDLASLLYENRQALVWNNEIVAAGSTSIAVQLRRERGAYYPNGISVEITFSASPGVFEVDVMTSDTDKLANFVQLAAISTVNAAFVGRVELPNIYAKYVALFMKTSPNAATVSVTGQITR